MKGVTRLWGVVGVWLLAMLMSAGAIANKITVKGLFAGSAVLEINGQQRLLKQGKTSPEGVKLISANSKMAVVEVSGQRHTLKLSQGIAGAYKAPEKKDVRILSSQGGHFYTNGNINGQSVNFLVDTGATFISMNQSTADRLNIDYRSGRRAQSHTANGMAQIYVVSLRAVEIGGLVVNNVQASVHLGSSPETVLLGNSFLSKMNMKTEGNVLILSSKI
ncbi:TIGR02281 family clan AA aspartic protease [Marinibactrum halimedae]|uniref:TIGR02281 family clan AA aspartic protease n=1 Tax=Marinibactrum halimedae TaxID=1444977 RepID=A0AA37TAG8_9GAMM|nr:TIGR02281 family clan AA aspartic protease [Marinibactrum halimedae]MCD9460524.1 TIGR02281 family clan AA aspartic protease [Marinibactrum halimedae]GLS27887.1 hypothetical protein GCM10007877_36060 [Marinibactrum halimedae]